MTIQVDTPEPMPLTVEHVLVIGTDKLWDEWVRRMMREYVLYTYHISREVFETYWDTKTVYYFVSSNLKDEEITQQLMGKEFHGWYNLGVQVSPEVVCYIRTRCRLT